MKPKVSIIMGIYNCETTLNDAVKSIVDQTYSNWQLIMCDDCSTDQTYEVASALQKQYPDRILLLRNQKNMRLAATLNHCLQHADGEYVARMDADDLSFSQRLEKQVDFLENNSDYQVVSCKCVVFDENGEREVIGVEGEPSKKCMLYTVPFVHPTIMMRRSAYEAIGGYTVLPRTVRGQDVDLWFKFFSKGYRGYILPDVLYKYYNLQTTLKIRKNYKLALCYVKTNLVGFRLLHFPVYKYVFAFKPLISTLLPERLKIIHRKWK